jgi:uncharacterized protein
VNIVCDTNVLISGILFGGHTRQILRLASQGVITNFISSEFLRELEDVLLRPKFGLNSEQVLGIISLTKDSFESVVTARRVSKILNDPDDNHILATASKADASFIVSGDRHLLDIKEWEGIRMISPAEFMKEIIGI